MELNSAKLISAEINSMEFEKIRKESGGVSSEAIRELLHETIASALEKGIKTVEICLPEGNDFGFSRANVIRTMQEEIDNSSEFQSMEIFLRVPGNGSEKFKQKLEKFLSSFSLEKSVKRTPLLQSAARSTSGGFAEQFFKGIRPLGSAVRKTDEACEGSASEKRNEYTALEFGMDEVCEAPVLEIDDEELRKRVSHIADPFGKYVLHLSERKGISLTELENTAWLSKHVIFRLRKDPVKYHPDKRIALQLCVGLELNLDETRDVLMRAGYALSPSSLEDMIWEFFIEQEHFDIIDISDSLENYGLKPIINF